MKIQIFSDLHGDVHPVKPITILPGVDLVIVAGDTCESAIRAFEYLRRVVPMHIPIAMVLGNHEYYRHCIPEEIASARSQAASLNIYLLENATVILAGRDGERAIRVVGATFWTDYLAFGKANQFGVMNTCATGMNDHRLITWRKQPWRRFRPQEAALVHRESKAYLTGILATPFDGSTVVVTHHAVHWNSVHPKFQSDPLTAAFVSDQSALIERFQPTLWVHGHVHNSSDYRVGGGGGGGGGVGGARIICNPHGYGSENDAFNGAMVVEIE
jgi:hypothetical protein